MKTSNRPILLVEDDQVDIMTTKRALKEIHVSNPLVSKEDGEQALAYLHDAGGDKINSFNFGVAGYMAKPVDYRQFVEVMRSIDIYWSISEMP